MDQELKNVFGESIEQSNVENNNGNKTVSYDGSGANGMRIAATVAMVLAEILVIVGVICLFAWEGRERKIYLCYSGLVCILSSTTYFFCVAIFRAIATMAEAAHIYKNEKLNK